MLDTHLSVSLVCRLSGLVSCFTAAAVNGAGEEAPCKGHLNVETTPTSSNCSLRDKEIPYHQHRSGEGGTQQEEGKTEGLNQGGRQRWRHTLPPNPMFYPEPSSLIQTASVLHPQNSRHRSSNTHCWPQSSIQGKGTICYLNFCFLTLKRIRWLPWPHSTDASDTVAAVWVPLLLAADLGFRIGLPISSWNPVGSLAHLILSGLKAVICLLLICSGGTFMMQISDQWFLLLAHYSSGMGSKAPGAFP